MSVKLCNRSGYLLNELTEKQKILIFSNVVILWNKKQVSDSVTKSTKKCFFWQIFIFNILYALSMVVLRFVCFIKNVGKSNLIFVFKFWFANAKMMDITLTFCLDEKKKFEIMKSVVLMLIVDNLFITTFS